MLSYFKQLIETLFPGYFAFVIATVLLYINIAAFFALWILTVLRILLYPERVFKDLSSHKVGSGFLTTVAGTCVLGSQLIIVASSYTSAVYLWGFAVFLWFLIMYSFFTAVIVQRDTPILSKGINGAWLIAAVATQAILILGTLLVPVIGTGREIGLFTTVCMYFLGCMLYLNIITLIFYRFTFLKMDLSAFTPPFGPTLSQGHSTGHVLCCAARLGSCVFRSRPSSVYPDCCLLQSSEDAEKNLEQKRCFFGRSAFVLYMG